MRIAKRAVLFVTAAALPALLLAVGWQTGLISIASSGPPPEVLTQSFSIRAGSDADLISGIHPASIAVPGPLVAIPCASLGLVCTDPITLADDDLSALSYGRDYQANPPVPSVEFSTAPGAPLGSAGTAVRGETAAPCAPPEAPADAFETGLAGTNVQDLDGDGLACGANTGFPLGLCEVGCSVADDVDALDQDPCGTAGPDLNCDGVPDSPVYFTLAPGSPSLSDPTIDFSDPMADATSADILVTVGALTPTVWADASALGLIEPGDAIDALCMAEDGDGLFGSGDRLLFSLAPGSPTLGALGASAADLLRPGPLVSYPASLLGLQATDDTDALKCPADDSDADSFFDIADNCPATSNPGQQNNVHPTTPDGDHCEDPDDDGKPDASDECPDVFSPWIVPSGDGDCDGFRNSEEAFTGTDPADPCPDDQNDDAWPADMVGAGGFGTHDKKVNILDIVQLTPPVFNTSPPNPNYATRKDLDGSGVINILDIVRLTPPTFNQTCT